MSQSASVCFPFYFESLDVSLCFSMLDVLFWFSCLFLKLIFVTCVSLSVLPLIVHTCVPLLSCINSPCLLVPGRCVIHVVVAMSVACRGSARLVCHGQSTTYD